MTETMQDSGVEWIGAMPQSWKLKRIKDIADLKSGDGIKAEDISPTGDYLVFGGNGVRGYTSSFTHEGYYALIGRQGALCGNINYASGKFWATEHAVVVTLIYDSFNTFWLGELLRTMNLNQYSNAAAQPGLSLDNIKFLKLPIPPIPEQQAIAQYLDERCGKLDSIISIKKQQIQTLDALRQSIIYQAVTKGLDDSVELVDSGVEWLGEIPKGWRKYRIKDVAAFSPNYSEEKPELGELCTVVPMENVSVKGEIDVSILQEYEVITKGLTFFENGDVIFAKITPCMENGKGAFVENLSTRYAFGSTEFHVLRSSFRINGKFLYYYTYCKTFRDYAAENMTGAAGQKRVSTNFLKYTVIHLPDITEQQKIVDYLDQETQRLTELKTNLSQQISVLMDYKKSLIYECVTGKKLVFKAG